MAKQLYKRALIIGISIIVFISIALICKMLFGQKIVHYKQYLLPCEGRIIAPLNAPATVSFYVLDEQEISELASKNNIVAINLLDKYGQKYNAVEWSVDPAGFYQGSTYSAKNLNITLTIEEEITANTIEIVYPDKKETMNIGELTITPMNADNYIAATQISSTPFSISAKSANDDYRIPSVLHVMATSFREGFTITHVDFGILGIGVDPSTVKFFEGPVDIGPSFKENPENAVYFTSEAMEQLPLQDVSIDIKPTDSQDKSFFIALKHDESYNSQFAIKYYAPVYTCIDHQSGVQYHFFDYRYYRFVPLKLIDDEQARIMLEEFGI